MFADGVIRLRWGHGKSPGALDPYGGERMRAQGHGA